MIEECKWPEGSCLCAMQQAAKPDYAGRVWMHCEEGLTATKASMSRFMLFCLTNNVEIGSVDAFAPNHPGCQVTAAVRIDPNIVDRFEIEVRAKLRKPPTLSLN